MKIIVTHASPDWDAIGSVWLLKRYLPGWQDAAVKFVPAGTRIEGSNLTSEAGIGDPIEIMGENQVIHVDTGLGPLDHHQTGDKTISGTGLVWMYIQKQIDGGKIAITETDKWQDRKAAIGRIVSFIVDTDHFKEVFWSDPAADYHEFTILGILDGLKLLKPEQDDYYVEFGREILESMLHVFENRIWAEREIEKALRFQTKWGEGLAFDTINDTVLKLAQKMGYVLVVRKDPRKGYVRIKARPADEKLSAEGKGQRGNYSSSDSPVGEESRSNNVTMKQDNNENQGSRQARTIMRNEDIDLTLTYEKLKAVDPHATWFLHASKKMLLNGTPKNPKMIPTKLTLEQIVKILETM